MQIIISIITICIGFGIYRLCIVVTKWNRDRKMKKASYQIAHKIAQSRMADLYEDVPDSVIPWRNIDSDNIHQDRNTKIEKPNNEEIKKKPRSV